jgi:hypothetical protein
MRITPFLLLLNSDCYLLVHSSHSASWRHCCVLLSISCNLGRINNPALYHIDILFLICIKAIRQFSKKVSLVLRIYRHYGIA